MQRIVALPVDGTEADSKASFRNGVLEVRLKKARSAGRSRIEIE